MDPDVFELRMDLGVVRSKISRKYAICNIDGFLPEQRLAENWGVQYNSLKKWIFVRLWLSWKAQQNFPPVTSQNNQPIKFVKEKRVHQSDYGDFVGQS